MKKNVILLMSCLAFSSVYSQVGVNTTTPETTMDIRGTNHLGAVTAKDGLLVPRVNALSVPGTVNGQLVYLTDNNGTFTKGFHYWNGTAWTPFAGGGSGAGDPSIDAWVDNPTNTRVELGGKSDGSARTAGTEFVATDAGNVGIATTSPTEKLDVAGNIKFSGALMPNNVAGTAGQVLTSQGDGQPPLWQASGGTGGGIVIGYNALVSGKLTSWPGNNTLRNIDLSIGDGNLGSWRVNDTTLKVPSGKAGKYILSYTLGLRVNGSTPSSYSFFGYLKINGSSIATSGVTIGGGSGFSYNNSLFSLSWSEVVDLNVNDTIQIDGLTYGTSGTPLGFKLARLSLEKIE